MKRSERGAAKVSVVWMIGLLVVVLVTAVMFFLVSGEATKEKARADQAEAKIKELDTKLTTEIEQLQKLSAVVGFYDEAQASRTEPDAVTKGLKDLRETFTDIDPSVKNLQKAMPIVIQAYTAQKNKVKDLETKIASLSTENETLNKNMRDLADTNSKELAALRSQLQDAEQAKTDVQADLERQLAEARDNYKNRDQELRTTQGKMEEASRKSTQEQLALRTRLDEQGRKLNPFMKEPEAADGKILGVSKDLGLGWINLGAKNRLSAGTRFRVVSGAHGSNQVKAWAEVTRVDPDMAEVHFTDQKDPFDPPVIGDVVFNPLFDPSGDRHAVLVGRFSGAMNDKQLKAMLTNMGITVQKDLDKSTDFLIVGSEEYTDDAGQPLAEPVQPTDKPIYKDAIANGVQIVLLKDLRQYFKF